MKEQLLVDSTRRRRAKAFSLKCTNCDTHKSSNILPLFSLTDFVSSRNNISFEGYESTQKGFPSFDQKKLLKIRKIGTFKNVILPLNHPFTS